MIWQDRSRQHLPLKDVLTLARAPVPAVSACLCGFVSVYMLYTLGTSRLVAPLLETAERTEVHFLRGLKKGKQTLRRWVKGTSLGTQKDEANFTITLEEKMCINKWWTEDHLEATKHFDLQICHSTASLKRCWRDWEDYLQCCAHAEKMSLWLSVWTLMHLLFILHMCCFG